MCPPAKVNGVWPFNDAWLRTSLEEARRQAPRNVASILDSARELGIRDAQVAALKTSGCELIFRDNASGGRWDRPELHKLLSQLRKGDVVVVWTLDRLSRSLRDVLTIMERVQERHAGFRSLKEAVDTTTPAGRMMMQMVGAFAEFERAMLKERTKAGLDAARKEGRIGGRPPKLKPHQQQEIVTLVKQGKKTAADAARLFGVHPATVSRLLRRT